MEEQELIVLRGTVPISTLIMLELVRRQNRKQSKHGTIGQVNRMNDLISRQTVLDVLKDKWNMFSDANDAMQESIDTIEALTPLTPQPKRRMRLFKIIDNNTGKEPTYDVITEQAKLGDLMTDDIDGFYVNEDGQIIFVDDCGNCTWLDMNRFDIESGEEI